MHIKAITCNVVSYMAIIPALRIKYCLDCNVMNITLICIAGGAMLPSTVDQRSLHRISKVALISACMGHSLT